MPQLQNGFNRMAYDELGASVNKYAVTVAIDRVAPKILDSIMVSVAEPASPAVIEDYYVRVLVASQQGAFPTLPSLIAFNPITALNQDIIGDVGQIYFDHVMRIPHQQQIFFENGLYFNNGERVYISASVAYANGDNLFTVPVRNVRLSAHGRFVESAITNYRYR